MTTVIYDIDGVLNWLCEDVAAMMGAPVPNRYTTSEATNLTEVQKILIQAAYSCGETFRHLRWVNGSERVFDTKANVHLYSANLTQEVLDVKLEVCHSYYPPDVHDRIHMTIGKYKIPFENADIVIEDSVVNLMRYGPHTMKVLVDHPYNRGVYPGIIRVPTLVYAIDLVNKLVGDMSQ